MTDPKAMAAARRILDYWGPDYGNEDEVIVARALLAGEGPVPPPALEQFSKIEGYGFQCEGGPLENCQDWHGLKSQVTAAIAGIEKTISEFNISGKPDGYVCRAWLETALNSLKSSPFPTVRDARLDQWEDAEDGRHAARTEANEEPAVRDVTLR